MHLFLRIPSKGEKKFNIFKNVFIIIFLKISCVQKCFVVFNSQDKTQPSTHSPPCFNGLSGNPPIFPLQEVNGSE